MNDSQLQITYEDENIVALYKPQGFHVHPHENPDHRVHKSKVCLYVVRDLIGAYVYPVHRLDVGTSGILVMAKTKTEASRLGQLFQNHEIKKSYWAVVRGVPKEDEGLIEIPLELDSTGELVPASTHYKRVAVVKSTEVIPKSGRPGVFSLMRVIPKTGRFHQIRRHFNRISHPLIGDAQHGDSHNNRFFKEHFNISKLCLWADEIHLPQLGSEDLLTLKSPLPNKWRHISDIFQYHSLGLDADGK